MEELIELYLFKNKRCPLPSLGSLHLENVSAVAMYSDRKITAPVPVIIFSGTVMPADDFIAFIAARKNIKQQEASALLTSYCENLHHMNESGETKFPFAGRFYINEDGMLVFKSTELPKTYFNEVVAERVIHPRTSHTMVVGDKETTSTAMEAFYSEAGMHAKDKWWIWALAFGILTAVLFGIYFNDKNKTASFGNVQTIQTAPDLNTYQIAE